MTVLDLIQHGYKNWNDAYTLSKLGAELEERSRFNEARLFLNRAFELDNSLEDIYLSLAFTHFRDISSSAEVGEEILVDGIENTSSDILKAWHIAFVEEEDIARRMVNVLLLSDSVYVQLTVANSLLWRGDIQASYEKVMGIRNIENNEKSLAMYCNLMIWLSGTYKDIQLERDIAPFVEKLISYNKNCFSYQNMRIMLFQSLQNWKKVQLYCIEALRQIPDNETLMLALAMAYENLGDNDNAAMWYSRAIGAKYSFVRARLRLAYLLEKQGKIHFAIEVIQEIFVCNPNYAMGHIQAAFFLFKHHDKKVAATLFSRAYSQLKPYEKQSIDNNPMTHELAAFHTNTVIITPSLN